MFHGAVCRPVRRWAWKRVPTRGRATARAAVGASRRTAPTTISVGRRMRTTSGALFQCSPRLIRARRLAWHQTATRAHPGPTHHSIQRRRPLQGRLPQGQCRHQEQQASHHPRTRPEGLRTTDPRAVAPSDRHPAMAHSLADQEALGQRSQEALSTGQVVPTISSDSRSCHPARPLATGLEATPLETPLALELT